MSASHESGPLTSTNGFIGALTGNVTGNVTGGITGNVTGNVIGDPNPTQSTIVAASGATNTSTVTVTLKDVAGSALTKVTPFTVYCSSTADGLTLASAASTGWSVASGGLSINNAGAVTTSICAVSSATGTCVLSLLDTGKTTSYLVLVLPNGVKISAQLTSGSYG